MDGTRDRPPGKTAQNWSRKDGIRAGSVSGPWRSSPRDPVATTPVSPRSPNAAPSHPDVTPRVMQTRLPDYHQRAQSRRTLVMGGWIAFGVLAAIAIVMAAVLFRPVAPPPSPAEGLAAATEEAVVPAPPGPEAAAAPAASETAAVTRTPSDPALTGVSTVRLRIGPEFPADRQAAILAALSDAGVPEIRVEPLPFRIATTRVGYYRAADLAAAEALGRLVAPVIAEGAEIGVRDYGQLLADPEPGRLDLWVGG